jgi:hypothetical protein
MSVSRFNFYSLIAACFLLCAPLASSATDAAVVSKTYMIAQGAYSFRLKPGSTPTYPGTAGMPTLNINDAHPGVNVPLPSGSPTQILQQNFPVPNKGNDADTFMPAALLEKSLGPLSAPRKETHIY